HKGPQASSTYNSEPQYYYRKHKDQYCRESRNNQHRYSNREHHYSRKGQHYYSSHESSYDNGGLDLCPSNAHSHKGPQASFFIFHHADCRNSVYLHT
ncbi:hypothetical protein Celaphus_00003797, partial [Cervus elaphus hippelaphus]